MGGNPQDHRACNSKYLLEQNDVYKTRIEMRRKNALHRLTAELSELETTLEEKIYFICIMGKYSLIDLMHRYHPTAILEVKR